MADDKIHRCFMDGIDWQHHLDGDVDGTLLFPSEGSLRRVKTCLSGGCGVVEVEVRLVRWVEPQDLKYETATPSTVYEPITDDHAKAVCKIGQGHDCCRYLTMGPRGWSCEKRGPLRELLDGRVADKSIVARGNNCEGRLSR